MAKKHNHSKWQSNKGFLFQPGLVYVSNNAKQIAHVPEQKH